MGRNVTIIQILAAAMCVLLAGCGGRRGEEGNRAVTAAQPENMMKEATLLRMYDEGDFLKAEVVNPWDTASLLATYVLVERGVRPDSLPAGDVTVVEVPLERSLVYSPVHAGVIAEMGRAAAVAGVTDAQYFGKEPYASLIKSGKIADAGSSMSPSAEAIVALKPDAILLSPFENAGHGALLQMGVPLIECADYMEETPKGRAEWVRFFGALYGTPAAADSIFARVEATYDEIKGNVSTLGEKPTVITEMLTDGCWFVPGGHSYMARLLQDAGATYPWSNNTSAGSLQLDFSSVYAKAADADFWLIRTFGHDLTLSDLRSVYLLNSQFKAFKRGNVYVANTGEVPLFDEFPFHPELLLAEYAEIFHPGSTGGALRYYHRCNP